MCIRMLLLFPPISVSLYEFVAFCVCKMYSNIIVEQSSFQMLKGLNSFPLQVQWNQVSIVLIALPTREIPDPPLVIDYLSTYL